VSGGHFGILVYLSFVIIVRIVCERGFFVLMLLLLLMLLLVSLLLLTSLLLLGMMLLF